MKDPLLGLIQFLTTEDPLKMIKKCFFFVLKALVVFGYVEKCLDKKAEVNFKFFDITDWTANNYNGHIAQYLKR